MADTEVGPQEEKEKPKKPINLLRGWPSPHLLPTTQLAAAAAAALADPAVSVAALSYGLDPGFQPLREELARWLSDMYGDYPGSSGGGGIKADEIAITGGASQSLACLLQSFTDPGYTRAIWLVAPCYFMACPIFEDAGFRGRLRAVPEDEWGVDLEALEKALTEEEARKGWENHPFKSPYPDRKLYRHVIYLVATCANPSGKTLSLARRKGLVHLARKHDALIISDDVYDFLQWPVTTTTTPSAVPSPLPKLLPLLSQIDASLYPPPSKHNQSQERKEKRFSHAISNASFSKLVGPGIRTGWIHGTPDSAYGFSQTGSNRSGGAASQFAAAVVWRMLSGGELEGYLDRVVRPALRGRHRVMLDVARRVLAPMGVGVWGGNGVGGAGVAGEEKEEEMFGGYFVWLTLPVGLDAAVVADRAREEEALVVAPGGLFEVAGDEETARFPRNVRLSFSWEDEEDLVEGVERLGRVLRRILDGTERKGGAGKGTVEADVADFK
ncbi:pyridoxal phosphate-dependent transferase [Chaetomidium leptoderma]|uniref:Pyridoxal phosphate-dependent transferase n=1 Tax=Chaetomidium leptoderma TaxID=669021 RepID=A0AAN6VXB1_9PEZI|nr:pyridoxal phosphate-dependent transferase [Chaetomidium leptoderma]